MLNVSFHMLLLVRFCSRIMSPTHQYFQEDVFVESFFAEIGLWHRFLDDIYASASCYMTCLVFSWHIPKCLVIYLRWLPTCFPSSTVSCRLLFVRCWACSSLDECLTCQWPLRVLKLIHQWTVRFVCPCLCIYSLEICILPDHKQNDTLFFFNPLVSLYSFYRLKHTRGNIFEILSRKYIRPWPLHFSCWLCCRMPGIPSNWPQSQRNWVLEMRRMLCLPFPVLL